VVALQVVAEEHGEDNERDRPQHEADRGGQHLLSVGEPPFLLIAHSRQPIERKALRSARGRRTQGSTDRRENNVSVTTPTQTDELRIVGGATATDAQLIVAMQHNDAISGAHEGWQLLRSFDAPPTLAQLRKRYPPDSQEYRCISAFLGSCETTGTFVKQGLLHEGLVHDLYWIAGPWRQSEKICKGLRKESGEARMFENFELLASRAP
jgi:hypothetical protein